MPFFKSVRRAPAPECGTRKAYITTKAGVRIWLDPHSEERSGPTCLDIPVGRRFMRKLMGRYQALEKQRRFVDVTQIRGMVKFVSSVREQHGDQVAKAVRLLASQMMNGFEVVALNRDTVFDKLNELGVHLQINGRQITIRDLEGEFTYQDDFYYTATKWSLLELMRRYKLPLTLVDQRDRNSVQKVLGDKSDISMVKFYASGEYQKHRLTKFWGGVGLENCRKVVFRDDVVQVGRGIKIVKTRFSNQLNWQEAKTKEDWLKIFDNVISHNFDKKETEPLKQAMKGADFKRVRDRLKKWGAIKGPAVHSLRAMSEYCFNALNMELGYEPRLWMCFVVRGCNNLLQYQGDRLDRLIKAHDEITSVCSSMSSASSGLTPGRLK